MCGGEESRVHGYSFFFRTTLQAPRLMTSHMRRMHERLRDSAGTTPMTPRLHRMHPRLRDRATDMARRIKIPALTPSTAAPPSTRHQPHPRRAPSAHPRACCRAPPRLDPPAPQRTWQMRQQPALPSETGRGSTGITQWRTHKIPKRTPDRAYVSPSQYVVLPNHARAGDTASIIYPPPLPPKINPISLGQCLYRLRYIQNK
jgi:hypothetical protein